MNVLRKNYDFVELPLSPECTEIVRLFSIAESLRFKKIISTASMENISATWQCKYKKHLKFSRYQTPQCMILTAMHCTTGN